MRRTIRTLLSSDKAAYVLQLAESLNLVSTAVARSMSWMDTTCSNGEAKRDVYVKLERSFGRSYTRVEVTSSGYENSFKIAMRHLLDKVKLAPEILVQNRNKYWHRHTFRPFLIL